MSLTLLVGAPGSLLSGTAARLGVETNSPVIDVESRLLADLSGDDERAVRSRKSRDHKVDMAVVTRAFPRRKVLALWEAALAVGLSELSPESNAIVACHLTLYRSDRNEFYSTAAQLASVIGHHGHRVSDVVQLIDDIYDMYTRLSISSAALSAEIGFKRWRSFTQKSVPSALWEAVGYGLDEAQHLELETRVQTLSLLLNWRHQESLSAESLANSLSARYTAFGAKHSFRSLQALAGNGHSQPVRTVYISHPISAYRRDINRAVNRGVESPEWHPGVRECNAIPSLIEHDGGLIAIMPTAIDELRFKGLPENAQRLTERSPLLGPRWPLIDGGRGLIAQSAADVPITDVDVQHTNLLLETDSKLSDQQFVGELTRLFESTIYNEIPYRDHLIVANSDALLVHRPLADKARLSSGVEHEVRHWRDRKLFGDTGLRLGIIHSHDDLLLLRGRWVGSPSVLSSLDVEEQAAEARKLKAYARSGIEAYAKEHLNTQYELDPDEAEQILRGDALSIEQLGGRTEFGTPVAAAELRREAIVVGITGFLLERLTLLRNLPHDGVRVFLTDHGSGLTHENTKPVREFLQDDVGSEDVAATVIGDGPTDFGHGDILIAPSVMAGFLNLDILAVDIAHAQQLGEHPSEDQRDEGRRAAATQAALALFDVIVASTSRE